MPFFWGKFRHSCIQSLTLMEVFIYSPEFREFFVANWYLSIQKYPFFYYPHYHIHHHNSHHIAPILIYIKCRAELKAWWKLSFNPHIKLYIFHFFLLFLLSPLKKKYFIFRVVQNTEIQSYHVLTPSASTHSISCNFHLLLV